MLGEENSTTSRVGKVGPVGVELVTRGGRIRSSQEGGLTDDLFSLSGLVTPISPFTGDLVERLGTRPRRRSGGRVSDLTENLRGEGVPAGEAEWSV
jgi:hypothetical protein